MGSCMWGHRRGDGIVSASSDTSPPTLQVIAYRSVQYGFILQCAKIAFQVIIYHPVCFHATVCDKNVFYSICTLYTTDVILYCVYYCRGMCRQRVNTGKRAFKAYVLRRKCQTASRRIEINIRIRETAQIVRGNVCTEDSGAPMEMVRHVPMIRHAAHRTRTDD